MERQDGKSRTCQLLFHCKTCLTEGPGQHDVRTTVLEHPRVLPGSFQFCLGLLAVRLLVRL